MVGSVPEQRLSVTLPHYSLSFFINEKEELESRDFKNMVYDEDQYIGALFGLENLLVLRLKAYLVGTLVLEALIHRRVLIPNGFPIVHGNHWVRIDVNTTAGETGRDTALYHTYDVDTELGCLMGNGSLMSTRYLAYLHAMTSFHRPDPLTGKTGARAALCLMQSAGCRSIMMVKAFDGYDRWTSIQYPQIKAAYKEIQNGYYWRHSHYGKGVFMLTEVEKHAVQRAAYLFPSNATGPASLEHGDENIYTTTPVSAEPGSASLAQSSFKECFPTQIPLDQLLRTRPVPELPVRTILLRNSHKTSSNDIPALDQLFPSLRVHSLFQREYITRLDASAQHFCANSQRTHWYEVAGENRIEALRKHYVRCKDNFLGFLNNPKSGLGPTSDPHEQALDRFGQWPPITADVLLQYLASTSPIIIPQCWKECLISLALLLLDLQCAWRLLRLALDGLEEEFLKELENEGCEGWKAEDYPDWLLIQVT